MTHENMTVVDGLVDLGPAEAERVVGGAFTGILSGSIETAIDACYFKNPIATVTPTTRTLSNFMMGVAGFLDYVGL